VRLYDILKSAERASLLYIPGKSGCVQAEEDFAMVRRRKGKASSPVHRRAEQGAVCGEDGGSSVKSNKPGYRQVLP